MVLKAAGEHLTVYQTLIDWVTALLRAGVSQEKLEAHIPFVGALLKKAQDVNALSKYDAQGGRYPKSWHGLGPCGARRKAVCGRPGTQAECSASDDSDLRPRSSSVAPAWPVTPTGSCRSRRCR